MFITFGRMSPNIINIINIIKNVIKQTTTTKHKPKLYHQVYYIWDGPQTL